MKRLFTMGLALLMVLTMVPMSCHASTMTRKLVHIPGGVVSSSEFEAWGKSPIMLATGYADGIYDVKYK